MKFSLFTEVQCPSGASPVKRLDDFLIQAGKADELGYHGLWISELHFQPEFSVFSAPYPVLGAVSQRTKRIRMGVAVNILPVHHPLQLAEQAAMIDLLSHGRMDFAIGMGHFHSRVYEGFGIEQEKGREMMEESVQVIRAAWTQDVLEFEGRYYRIPEVVPNPRPLQNPPPPIYTATGSLDGIELAARLGLNLLLPLHTMTRERIKESANAYWASLENHGRTRSEGELGLLVSRFTSPKLPQLRVNGPRPVSWTTTVLSVRFGTIIETGGCDVDWTPLDSAVPPGRGLPMNESVMSMLSWQILTRPFKNCGVLQRRPEQPIFENSSSNPFT
jgi:hypothetical protein